MLPTAVGAARFLTKLSGVWRKLTGGRIFQPVEHAVVPVDPSKFKRSAGTFDFVKVTQDGSHLMAEIPLGSKAQKLLPESDTQNLLRDEPTRAVYDLNADGGPRGLEFIATYVHLHRAKNLRKT